MSHLLVHASKMSPFMSSGETRMKFQFSLDFFIGAPSTRFHISNLQKSRTEKYMNIKRENEQKP